MSAIIEVDELRRTFVVQRRRGRLRRERHEVRAVDGISFEIGAGEAVGYIGPNGAGKSTTVKMLTGILVPSGGRLRVAGLDPSARRTELARQIGVVFGQRTGLWWDLPLRDSYELLGRIYRVPRRTYDANLERLVDLLELGPLLEQPVRQLSLGQRMRGDIAAALLHEPAILYLDEPTIGLDLVSKGNVREFLTEVNRERGVTILLTTHDLDEAETLADRIIILVDGRIIADGTTEQLARQIVGHDEVRWVQDGAHHTRSVPDSTAFVRELFAHDTQGISELEIRRASLEATYLALVRDAEPAAAAAVETELEGASR
jgi:ABC-2 type transport system ATP-binding protein